MSRQPVNRWLRCFRAGIKAVHMEWNRTPHSVGYFLTPLYRYSNPDVCIQGMGGGGGGATIPSVNRGTTYTFTSGNDWTAGG